MKVTFKPSKHFMTLSIRTIIGELRNIGTLHKTCYDKVYFVLYTMGLLRKFNATESHIQHLTLQHKGT